MKKILLAFLMICLLALTAVFAAPRDADIKLPSGETEADGTDAETDDETCEDYIQCLYYDAQDLNSQSSEAKAYTSGIFAGIAPHYAPAMDMLCSLLDSCPDDIDTVVVIAPNHKAIGPMVQITSKGYAWEDGAIDGDDELCDLIAADETLQAARDSSRAALDHSAQIMTPYIEKYLPNARIVTVLVTRGTDEARIRSLAHTLYGAAEDKKLLVLGSADFSHYESPQSCSIHDTQTERVIGLGNIAQLMELPNANIDSPETVAAVMCYTALCGGTIHKLDSRRDIFTQDGIQRAASYYVYGASHE